MHERKAIRTFILLSYVLILAIVLLVGMILYTNSSQRVRAGLDRQNSLSLNFSSEFLEDYFRIMNATSRQIASDQEFQRLAKMNGEEAGTVFHLQGYRVQQNLISILPIQSVLPQDTWFLYLPASGNVVSRTAFSSLQFYLNRDLEFQGSVPDLSLIESCLMSRNFWGRFIPMRQLNFNRDGFLYITPVSSSISPSAAADSVLVYVFDEENITDLFNEVSPSDSSIIKVYDTDGNNILSLGEDTDLNDADIRECLSDNPSDRNTTSEVIKGTRYVFTTHLSESGLHQYVSIEPEASFYYSITQTQILYSRIVGAAFLIGLLIAVFMSRIESLSIDKVHNELKEKSSLLEEQKNQLLETSSRLDEKNNELSRKETELSDLNEQVKKQQPAVVESYVRRIMEGQISSPAEQLQIANTLGLNVPGYKYQVLYAEVTPADNSEFHAQDVALAMENYDLLVREAMKRYFPNTGYLFKPSGRIFAVLLSAKTELPDEEIIQNQRTQFTKLHDELLQNYGIRIAGGLGMFNTLLSYTWKSYQQAREAKSLCTHENFFISDLDFAHSSDVYYYPESFVLQLSGFISSGNRRQTAEAFKMLIRENTSIRRLSSVQRRLLISAVRSTIEKCRQTISTDELSGEQSNELDSIDRQLTGELSLDALKAIALQLCEIYGSETKSSELIGRIQEYISKNYDDPELGLSRISEKFQISENYFSSLFKKEMKENFSTYLEHLRMVKACELITEGRIPLSQIYQYLGYTNPSSFRRAFRKNYNISPSEMRQQSRPHSSGDSSKETEGETLNEHSDDTMA